MKIFFTSPYEGKKLYQYYIDKIVEIIESTGAQVVSPEKTREYQDAFRRENLIKLGDKDRVHYEFIRQGIANSDAVIIEASYEDFRVGHEATLAITYKKPILCLSLKKDYSKFIHQEGFEGAKYADNTVEEIVKIFLAKVSKTILSKRKSHLNFYTIESGRAKQSVSRQVAVLGSINIDLITKVPKIPQENEVVISEGLKLLPGGKATNTAIGMARLGIFTHMVGKIGYDSFGEEVLSVFRQEGIDTKYVDTDAFIPTGTVMVNVDARGKNTIIVNEDANIRINKKVISDMFAKFDQGKLRIDCFYFTLESLSEIVEFTIKKCKERNILLFCDAAPQTRPLHPRFYPDIDFLSANEFEASSMTGHRVTDIDSANRATQLLRQQGARNIIITLGYLGAVFLPEGEKQSIYYPGKKVKVVDETAAGDAFRAGFVVEYLTTRDLNQALEFANLVGAYAVTKLGAYQAMPTREGLQFLEVFK